MSLTSFLKNKDVKEKFKQQFTKPRFSLKKEVMVAPQTKRYSLVGTAFDYLLRFYLERLNSGAVTSRWVAESALNAAYRMDPRAVTNLDSTGEISVTDDRGQPLAETVLTKKIKGILDQSKIAYNNYLVSGEINDEVIEGTLRLAQLDPLVRAGYINDNLGSVDSQDVDDLRKLISIVDPEMFKAKELCMLNPTFGEASRLVGGADADLVIDDMLIDIKTTKNLAFSLDYFHQLLGYYILSTIGGVDDAPHPPTIRRLGIYFSRHAELYTLPVESVVNDEDLPSFIEWFTERATS